MKDLKPILGRSIVLKNLDLKIHSMTIDEYQDYNDLFNVLTLTTNRLLQVIDINKKDLRKYIDNTVKNFDVICLDEQGITQLIKLFEFIFETKDITSNSKQVIQDIIKSGLLKLDTIEDIQFIVSKLGSISITINGKEIIYRDNFDYIRSMILKSSGVSLPKQAKNTELQEWFNKAYKAKGNTASNIDMEDVLIAIMMKFGYTPEIAGNLTLYQINHFIEKINKLDEYERNVQFCCAGAEDVKLDSWLEHKDENIKHEGSTDFNSFKQSIKSAL